MKKRKRNRAERARKKRARREEKRQMKGTMTMAEKKIITAEQIHAYVKKEKYAEAINAFADALSQGEPPKECYADVARAYFELGDYKRAADWVSNALSLDPGNVDVRILLARICQRERRTDDALKLYENILAAHTAALTAAQRAEIERRAGLDARLAQDKTRTAYPISRHFWGLPPYRLHQPYPLRLLHPVRRRSSPYPFRLHRQLSPSAAPRRRPRRSWRSPFAPPRKWQHSMPLQVRHTYRMTMRGHGSF